MATEMRKTGIDIVGYMPWGTHICLFYETKQDLLDTLVAYCIAGLKNEELCLWVVAEPVTIWVRSGNQQAILYVVHGKTSSGGSRPGRRSPQTCRSGEGRFRV